MSEYKLVVKAGDFALRKPNGLFNPAINLYADTAELTTQETNEAKELFENAVETFYRLIKNDLHKETP